MEILLENYANIVHIEALTAIDIARKHIVPSVIGYEKFLLEELNLKKAYDIGAKKGLEERLFKDLSELSEKFHVALEKLVLDVAKYDKTWTNLEKATYCMKTLLCDMAEVRSNADAMELLIGKEYMKLPTYEDILYSVKY